MRATVPTAQLLHGPGFVSQLPAATEKAKPAQASCPGKMKLPAFSTATEVAKPAQASCPGKSELPAFSMATEVAKPA